ncbi:MAG: glycosyltransferase [Oceanidesulfovibrio sp.]
MAKAPLINISIPVFNRPELTVQTIRSVKNTTSLPHIVTVVDNGSDEETQSALLELKKAGFINYLFRLEKNYGVACAANIGWRMVSCPIYMKLDNDILIKSHEWLEMLLLQFKRINKPVVMGADLNNQLNNSRYVRKREGIIGRTFAHVSGGAILIPREISDIVGYWCEDYGLYGCEDGDYGVRLNVFGIKQYYFDHTLFMEHLGHDEETYHKNYGLRKKKTQNIFRPFWETNKYLYSYRHRAPHPPLQYKITGYDGYNVTLGNNTAYKPMLEALIEFHNVKRSFQEDSREFVRALNIFMWLLPCFRKSGII